MGRVSLLKGSCSTEYWYVGCIFTTGELGCSADPDIERDHDERDGVDDRSTRRVTKSKN